MSVLTDLSCASSNMMTEYLCSIFRERKEMDVPLQHGIEQTLSQEDTIGHVFDLCLRTRLISESTRRLNQREREHFNLFYIVCTLNVEYLRGYHSYEMI